MNYSRLVHTTELKVCHFLSLQFIAIAANFVSLIAHINQKNLNVKWLCWGYILANCWWDATFRVINLINMQENYKPGTCSPHNRHAKSDTMQLAFIYLYNVYNVYVINWTCLISVPSKTVASKRIKHIVAAFRCPKDKPWQTTAHCVRICGR